MSFSKPKVPKAPEPDEALEDRKRQEDEAAEKARQQAALRQGRRALSQTSVPEKSEDGTAPLTLF